MNVMERFEHKIGNVLAGEGYATDLSRTYGFGLYDEVVKAINVYPSKKSLVVKGNLSYERPRSKGLQYIIFNNHYYNDVPVEMACQILHNVERCEEWHREVPEDKKFEATKILVIVSSSQDCCFVAHRREGKAYKEFDKDLGMEIEYKPEKLKISGDLRNFMVTVADIDDF